MQDLAKFCMYQVSIVRDRLHITSENSYHFWAQTCILSTSYACHLDYWWTTQFLESGATRLPCSSVPASQSSILEGARWALVWEMARARCSHPWYWRNLTCALNPQRGGEAHYCHHKLKEGQISYLGKRYRLTNIYDIAIKNLDALELIKNEVHIH